MQKIARLGLTILFFFFCISTASLHAQTSPSGITNLQLWLDASDPNGNSVLPANGTTITSWKDKSGNNKHTYLYNSGSGYVSPVYYQNQINGKGVIRFTRGSSGIIGSGYAAPLDIRAMTNPEVTMFTVYKQGTRVGDQAVWGCDNGGFDRFFFSSRVTDFDKGSVSIGNSSPFLVDVTGAGQLGTVKCLTAVYSKAGGAGGSAIYFNGQLVTSFTDYTTLGTDALADVRVGLDGDDNFYNGDIAEMIIYNRKLTACEITQVNRYLNTKYGVSFSTVSIAAGGATTFNEGQSVALSATTTGTAYQWLKDGVAISAATNSSYTATTSGNYSLAATNGCRDTSAAIAVTVNIPAPPATALHFDGVDDYIDAGSTILAQNIKTLECWVKFNNLTTTQEIVSKSKTGYGIELLLYNNTLSFYCMNNTNASYISYPAPELVTGRWYHLAATWDGADRTTMRLYMNGVSVGTRTDLGNINSSGIADPGAGSRLYVGAWNDPARYFNGSIDEVRVWSLMRTQNEVRAGAYDTIPRNTAGLLSYMRMDQGIAGGTNTGINKVKDYSSANQACTLLNFNLAGASSNYVESYAMVAPMPLNASVVTSTGFTARWNAPTVGALNNYVLDVSTSSSFSSFVAGYNGLNVGAVTSYSVTGLTNGVTYYYRVRANKTTVNGEGALTYASVTVIPGVTLPVKWQSFTANESGANVLLQWSTSEEINSASFTVERGGPGTGFTSIATIQAAGTTGRVNSYSYIDEHPATGVNYYRIRSTDIDGQVSYSQVKSVNRGESLVRVKVYPSPATEYIYVDLQQVRINKDLITIYNLQGQSVLNVKAERGIQKISISTLPPGIYLVKAGDEKPIKFEKK